MDIKLAKYLIDDSDYNKIKNHWLKQIFYIKDLNNIIFDYVGYFDLKKKIFYIYFSDYIENIFGNII